MKKKGVAQPTPRSVWGWFGQPQRAKQKPHPRSPKPEPWGWPHKAKKSKKKSFGFGPWGWLNHPRSPWGCSATPKRPKKKVYGLALGLTQPTPMPNGDGRPTPKALEDGFGHPNFALWEWPNHSRSHECG
jgi:hypothetical protein